MIHHARERWPELPLVRMCQLLALPRSLIYRTPADAGARQESERTLLEAIERLVTQFPGYGYRRVTAQLKREGHTVNNKRVLSLMRQEGLLCRQKRRSVATTQSQHGLGIYPNLVKALQPGEISGLNQLWVADLTYIRLPRGFCYLAAILDAFSRRCIGYALSDSLEAGVAVEALEMAFRERNPGPGLIHHSDRGVQYASGEYIALLERAQVRISMSRKARPRDNAQAESFFRTVKVEEVYVSDYADLEEAREHLSHFLEIIYNQRRLHSSLGYVPPVEFEDKLLSTGNCLSTRQGAS